MKLFNWFGGSKAELARLEKKEQERTEERTRLSVLMDRVRSGELTLNFEDGEDISITDKSGACLFRGKPTPEVIASIDPLKTKAERDFVNEQEGETSH